MSICLKITTKKKEKIYGEYPAIDYLNNALRILLKEKYPNMSAIEEICRAIVKADGKIFKDNQKKIDSLIWLKYPCSNCKESGLTTNCKCQDYLNFNLKTSRYLKDLSYYFKY